MNWKTSIIFCVSFLVAFLAEAVYVFSCGPEPDPYDYYVSFYNPAIPAKEGFEPFYYTGMKQYYGQEASEEDINLGEWHAFFSGKATTADIREFIYSYSRPQLAALYDHIEKGSALQAPDSVIKNTLTKYFISSKDRETLGYLMYAKQCEAHTSGKSDWEAPVRDTLIMTKLSRNGVQLYKACKNEQIRERYAFQATRLAHYSGAYAQAIRYYDSLAAPIRSASLIHYKTLALKAGALLRTGRKAESAYLFSRVFENAPSQREMAYLNTGWTGVTENVVMQHCANDREKAAVAALYAFRTFEYYPEGIRKVHRLFPQSPMLDALLAREINKLEDGFLYNKLTRTRYGGNHTFNLAADANTADIKAFQQLLDSMAGGGKVKEPALWHISSAYLSFMVDDFAGARTRLVAAKSGSLRPALQDQWEIVRLIVAVEEQPRIDKKFEAELLESFRWLDSRLDTALYAKERAYYYNPQGNAQINRAFYFRMYRNLLDYVIGTRYLQQGDVGRLALILSKRDKVEPYNLNYFNVSAQSFVEDSMQTAELQQLYTLQQQKKKTPFEQYLCDQFLMSENEVGEAIAVSYIRQHDFANAVSWFKKCGSSRSSVLSFTAQLEDFGYDSTGQGASHLEYATAMLQLEKKINRNKATAEDYYKYATGLFSISYYGHAYQFSAQYRPTTQWYTPAYDNNPMLKEYFGCYRAEEYYKKAADAATDREFKARCLYMAARCAQKHVDPEAKDYWERVSGLKNPYFPELVKEYGNTGFYQEITGRCGYLRDFVKLQPK